MLIPTDIFNDMQVLLKAHLFYCSIFKPVISPVFPQLKLSLSFDNILFKYLSACAS